jgi:hypothetical protein
MVVVRVSQYCCSLIVRQIGSCAHAVERVAIGLLLGYYAICVLRQTYKRDRPWCLAVESGLCGILVANRIVIYGAEAVPVDGFLVLCAFFSFTNTLQGELFALWRLNVSCLALG